MIIFIYFLALVQSACPDPEILNDNFEDCVNRELESLKNRSLFVLKISVLIADWWSTTKENAVI